MNELFINIISVVVTVVVIPLITLLGTKLIKWITTKIDDEKSARILSDASTIILNSVKTVFQTYVDALKKNGTFNQSAQEEAMNKAKEIALSQLSSETIKFIEKNYGDAGSWLTVQIEATINTLKNESGKIV